MHAEFGDALFDDFAGVAERLKAHLDPPEAEVEDLTEGDEETGADGDETSAGPRTPRRNCRARQ